MRFVCQEFDCEHSTRSETVFIKHLGTVHAVRPSQVSKLVEKAICLCTPGSKNKNSECTAQGHIE